MDDVNMDDVIKFQFIVTLTKSEKLKYDLKRKREGKTSQGCLRSLMLAYIGESENDEHTDG